MTKKKFIPYLIIAFACLAFLLPLVIALEKVLSGDIAFWYDPARDFLSAWDNLHKITLIGPTSGIPGIFYGPYWIWLLSVGLLFTKDPQTAILLVITLPYFILLPIILWSMRKLFGLLTLSVLWLLFMLGFGLQYATSPWNPYPATLLLMLLISVILNIDFLKKGYQKFIKTLVAGILSGLILNFHISFGLGVFTGIILFLCMYQGYYIFRKKTGKLTLQAAVLLLCTFLAGVFLAFLPFMLFELRHGFNQIHAAINVFTSKGSVVSLKGLSDALILQNFFEVPATLLKIPLFYSSILLIVSCIFLVYQGLKKQIIFTLLENKLLLLLISIAFAVLTLYLTSKNPVWAYHFIGVEIIFLLFIGIVVQKNNLLKILLVIWTICIAFLQVPTIKYNFHQHIVSGVSIAGEKRIVQTINNDAGGKQYTVFAYSPSIYMYEYSYLFRWLAQKDVPYDPGSIPANAETIYLIAPSVQDGKVVDFIHSHTPDAHYKTVKSWQIADGTVIMKRMRYEKK
jgi:hypothetical protein